MAVEKSNTRVQGVEILKPRTDSRDYRMIVLKNLLQVLLISDPDTDKCAASMSVSVGSFSDPQGLEGLAHFLEHMLFYASEKYPEEDSYSKYITEHGGSTNAYTASEETNYHFDVNADCFVEALDRFAQFFIKPLMSADATMREIKAVDSENQKNLLSDGWRMRQLQKHLSKEDHPYHKFSTGNMDTLHVRPQAKGVDTRSELIKFYEEHYSANIMHLVVYGKESLDKIQDLVEGMFQEIQNTNKVVPRFPGQPCTDDHLQILVKAVPIKQGHKLGVSWPVTPSIHHYEEGLSQYLGHLIGHEGEGSLFHALKTLGWATGLSAGEGEWTLDYSFFNVSIDLTDAGHEHMQEILGLLFNYIQLLQQTGVCQWIFDELSAICETKFHYQDKTPPMSYIVDIASNMQIYPTKDWLVGSSLPTKFNPATVQKVVDELSPCNVRILWESQKFEGQTDKAEPWYNTAYSLEKITSSTIQEWVLSAPDVNLHLPAPNVFIPTDFSLKDAKEKESIPVLLRKTPFSRMWYKPDTMFSKPKAYVKMDFNCPLAVSSPDAAVLTDIFTRLLMDYLNEYAYYAQVAGLYYGVSLSDNGFELTLLGYNHKLRILLETVVAKIANFEVKPDRFAVIKVTMSDFNRVFFLLLRNDSGIYGVQFIIQSSVKGPGHIDSRVESLLKNFESKLYEMSDEDFNSNVTALIDMKLEKHKNLKEESRFYWREIQSGTLKFNRKEAEVAALKQLQKQELIDFFDEYIKVGAEKKKSLSIRVYGSQHLKEMASDKNEVPSPCVEIEDIVGFRKSQPLHGSFRGCGQPKL
ncbi:PREDICTED: insulin-degrading enzyme-like 1, peroxisomal [Camelina sativa]|uniref:Insulin-degrading enzyme-like 1, peroxisomal n=1 Tax=Camelina sativa TaxID=90675 RepID=A0ABM1RSI4_CAMSA|nr:PREDICTED: insulin-degrading enzyme-like 1, peroxisomal [Camelina sativa]